MLTLMGTHLQKREPITPEQTAWYHKSEATFHDVLASIRVQIWKQQINLTAAHDPAVRLLGSSVLDRLLFAACF
ncbi:hypothetical protein [Dictyobacter aurantiacus]|uniref:Uncharacterized protein n=1 Tax=Dictyobacter aurantiacus TaxID=1936993 RepID=A0A401ZLV6_9CHLR|nr:hypothetical protein [Dictyobacter aurantiacus]GCE07812.1 hypothetical protein KDAU_51410 [Dictyobacter aurantiacus]